MCGIAGLVRWCSEGEAEADLLRQMSQAISHRGPDSAGYLLAGRRVGVHADDLDITIVDDAELGNRLIGLAHRRLAVIDLSQRGHCPMRRDTSSKTWIVYNGEVYNFRELRAELEQNGVEFATATDTEVVLAAYEYWGEDFISRCNGMFALAIFDPRQQKLLLYRDRVGIKPLYIREDEDGISFASELKGLLAGSKFQRAADRDAIFAYLDYQVIHHRPETFLQGVRELSPGHFMRIDLEAGKSETIRYYDLAHGVAARRDELPKKSEELAPFIRQRFIQTVRSHLVSDVRVGSCLSGGVDSSSIVCTADMLMRQQDKESHSLGDLITTFSSCHKDPRFDEQEYIDCVAQACSARSIKVFSSADDLAERFDTLVWHQDEPFTSASIFAQFLLMEAVRKEGVTVLLDGQGGDEIFAGYRKFFFFYMADLLRKGQVGKFASEMYGGLMKGDGDLFDFKAMRRYLPQTLRRNVKTFGRYLNKDASGDGAISGFGGAASIIDRQILDVERFSIPALLRYEDRNSMAFGIEARVPFLDHQLIETGIALPIEAKIKGGVAKHVLREAMRGLVPEKILNRRTKMGFVTPEKQWMISTLRPLMEEMLANPQPVTRELVDVKGVEAQYRLLVDDRASAIAAREFFRLLCLDRWIKLFNVTAV